MGNDVLETMENKGHHVFSERIPGKILSMEKTVIKSI